MSPHDHDPSSDPSGDPSGTSSLDPLPGRVVAGNFRIDKLIGAGAMGNVYKAEQLSLGKAVAVKVLHPHLMSDEKLVMRFKREAKSASLLNHPNSIQIIDSGQDSEGVLYIAMELLSGRDLAQVIRDDFPLPLPRVVRIMSQVLSALDEAHAQGVIHRDLKPSNIMLIERRGEKDFVKVCDFGIAKATSPDGKDEDRQAMLTIQGLVCGTPEYMAPEQARAEPLDGRADLYSAAVIMYQLVTGDIPFKAESPMGIVSRHLAEPPTAPSRRRADLPIPKVIDDIVLRGMEKSRELRFPTALAFREALESVVSVTPGQYTPVPPGVRAAMATATEMQSGETGVVPSTRAADRFGPTTDLNRAPRRLKVPVIATVAVLGLGAMALVALRRGGVSADGATAAGEHPPAATAASLAPAPPSPPPPAAAAPAPAPLAPAEAPAAPAPVQELPAAGPGAPVRLPVREHRHHKMIEHAAADHAAAPAPREAPAAATAPTVALAPDVPATRGPREVLTEGEKLLGQGEVGDACARGEEAKRLNPKLPAIYKFLGKCYMRAGNTGQAADNYKKYLDLAPNASDAPFIKSIIK